MPRIPIGRHNLDLESAIDIMTPVTVGQQTNGVKLVYPASEDIFLFGEEADQVREWLARQREANASPAPAAPITTKSAPVPTAVAKPTVATK